MIRTLVPKNPRVMLSTFNRAVKPTVRAMEEWANQEIDRIDFAGTMRKIASNALYSIGIAKVSIATPADAALSGFDITAGVPTIQSIDLDDFVYDSTARSFNEASFIGHRYRVPKVAAMKMLGKRAKDLMETEERQFNEQGDERLAFLGRPQGTEDEFEDMVTLWEIYLPRHRRVLTLHDDLVIGVGPDPTNPESYKPLLDQPWVGPYCGPYHFLGFQWVPGNAMPKGMMPDLLDLHLAANDSMRKLMRSVERIKEVGLVEATAGEDGERLVQANDGEMIKVQNLGRIQQMVFSGQHIGPLHAMATSFKDLFSLMGGNVELKAGAAPQSKTAAQDKMLNENASIGVADMQDATITFASKVLESWLWFHHHDPRTVQKAMHKGPRGDIARMIYPNQPEYTDPKNKNFKGRPLHVRDQSFESLAIRVDPYSLQHQTPQSKLNFLITTVQNLVVPLLPIYMQQGIALDLNTFLRKIGEYADQPDLDEILTIIDVPAEAQPGGGGPHERTLAPQTTRETVRHNVSEQTNQSANRNMIASGLGINTGGNAATKKQPAGV